jgi:hypothetical protein
MLIKIVIIILIPQDTRLIVPCLNNGSLPMLNELINTDKMFTAILQCIFVDDF